MSQYGIMTIVNSQSRLLQDSTASRSSMSACQQDGYVQAGHICHFPSTRSLSSKVGAISHIAWSRSCHSYTGALYQAQGKDCIGDLSKLSQGDDCHCSEAIAATLSLSNRDDALRRPGREDIASRGERSRLCCC